MNFEATAERIVADHMCSCSETAMEDAIVDALQEAYQAGRAEGEGRGDSRNVYQEPGGIMKCRDCKYFDRLTSHPESWGNCNWFAANTVQVPIWSRLQVIWGAISPDTRGCKVGVNPDKPEVK